MRTAGRALSTILALIAISCAAGARPRVPAWPGAAEQQRRGGVLPETMMDIGASVGADVQGIRISQLLPDGPAALAGLRDGDVLVAQDGRPLTGMDPRDFLRNPFYVRVGAAVEFTLLRGGASITRMVVCGRSVPNLAALTATANAPKPDDAGAVRIAAPPAQAAALTITQLALRPATVPAGARFTMALSYVAPLPAPLTFSYAIVSGDKILFSASDEVIDSGGGELMLYERSLGATSEPGAYGIRARLSQGGQAVERTAVLAITAREP